MWRKCVPPFSILRPSQQIWADIELQVDRWANLGLSLRQMQTERVIFSDAIRLRSDAF